MEFRIADTFADSLARLTHDKQKLVKTTAFDLQLNPASPGLSFHKLDRGKDKNFWSMRVGSDIRLIVHRSESSLLLCYVDHHDSWKSLGVDVRGRSRTLRVNYRTSHQIRSQADRLLGPSVTDVDGNTEDRSDTVSVFNGPPPRIQKFSTVPTKKSPSSDVGLPKGCAPALCHTRSVCLCVPKRKSVGPRKPFVWLTCPSTFWMIAWRRSMTMCRSAPCLWRRDWSSVQWS